MINKIEVVEVACIGCGTCWVACPDAFREHDIGDDLKALPTGRLGDQHLMRAAAEGCPTLAISLLDAEGAVLFPTEEARAALQATTNW
ncbi:ferredoxin [Thiocapsa imhoffii]|uniref:Ferredoxin n=1 Tax=Thiocapsa imhoffii TaxID=382777 RepID=A0A9X0WGP8_9GAMM|nr:ferredoxin [Thiocapsa imhoffii]MBK1644200.1 ferredoxin [Thiocapsa imhoffii]